MKRKLLITLLLASISFALNAQYAKGSKEQVEEQPKSLSLTLDEAVNYALEHNRTLQNSALDVRVAEAQRWQAIGSMLPQINASGDYTNMFGYKMSLGGMQVSLPNSASFGASAAIALSGAQVMSAIVSKISKEMSDINLEKTEQTTRDNVKNLYFSILATQESVQLLENSLESLQKLYRFTQKTVEVGTAESTDADQLLVQVASMENTVKSTKRTLEVLNNTLKLQLGVSPDSQVALTNTIEDLVNEATATSLLDEPFVKSRNLDYRLLQKTVELSKKQIHLTGWQNGPSVAVAYQYSKKHTFGDGMNMTPPNTLAVQLSIPIFTSLVKTKQIQAARLNYQKAVNSFNEADDALTMNYNQLKYNLASALEQYHTQLRSVEISNRVYNNISKKYELGAASALEVTNANTSLINAQSSYVQTLLTLIDAQVSLESLLNK